MKEVELIKETIDLILTHKKEKTISSELDLRGQREKLKVILNDLEYSYTRESVVPPDESLLSSSKTIAKLIVDINKAL